MKTPGWLPSGSWLPSGIRLPPSAKRDALLLPALFILNVFFFSAYGDLSEAATHPWLVLVWLYGLVMLVPLAWRDIAPVAAFATQWVLTVAAFPIMAHYTPVIGVPLALYAVSVHCDRKTSLLALLASGIPVGLDAASSFWAFPDHPAYALRAFIPNAIILFIVTVGLWGAGRVTRVGQQRLQQLEDERETVREAVAAERSRIA